MLSFLQYPNSAGLSIDSQETTIRRWEIIRQKPFLYQIYCQWYAALAAALPAGTEPVLEIGSGAGFFSQYVPNLITSDILDLPHIDHTFDACSTLPFRDASLRGIAMVNTLHHLPNCRQFLKESTRCLKRGGVITMIEPWVTSWSSFVYSRLHHEPFEPQAVEWTFDSTGPLSGANVALPWIIFDRDLAKFSQQFPTLQITKIELLMPVKYILSGGVSMRSLTPAWTFGFWSKVENLLAPVMKEVAMLAQITLTQHG